MTPPENCRVKLCWIVVSFTWWGRLQNFRTLGSNFQKLRNPEPQALSNVLICFDQKNFNSKSFQPKKFFNPKFIFLTQTLPVDMLKLIKLLHWGGGMLADMHQWYNYHHLKQSTLGIVSSFKKKLHTNYFSHFFYQKFLSS